MATTIQKTWTEFKTLVINNKRLKFQERDKTGYYDLWADEGTETTYMCEIEKGTADATDYENNYQSDANQVPSSNVDVNNEITIINEPRYRPRFWKSQTEVELSNSSDITIANININGKLDGISINFTRDDVEFVLEIDGTELMRIELSDLEDNNVYNLNSTGTDECIFPVKTTRAGRQIVINFGSNPVDVTSNITVKAKKTVNPTTNFVAGMIVYREKVTS